jgi:hypothetical protein
MTRRTLLLACLLAAAATVPAGQPQARSITLKEADAMWLEQARAACTSGSFNAFFQAFVRSQAVRDQYTASTLTRVVDRKPQVVRREAYRSFPVALSDNTYVAPDEQPPGAPPRYLRVTFTKGAAGEHQVNWVRVLYDGNGNDRDGQARVRATVGAPGRLTFRRGGNCWMLSDDAIGKGVDRPR